MSTIPDKVSFLLAGTEFAHVTSLSLKFELDSIDSFQASAPFYPDKPEFRTRLRPFDFQPVQVLITGEPVLVGTLMNVTPTLNAADDSATVQLSGYSLPGVLNDCNMPEGESPELNGLTLPQIAAKLCAPFGVKLGPESSKGSVDPYDRVAIEATETVVQFLAKLAREQGLVVTNNALGDLVFEEPASRGASVVRLVEGSGASSAPVATQGQTPIRSLSASFDGQGFFSEITGVVNASAGQAGSKHTEPKLPLSKTVRPKSFYPAELEYADGKTQSPTALLEKAVRARRGRMFGAAISYQVTLPTWRDALGRLFKPNTICSVHAPHAMIYQPHNFLIRSVTLNATSSEQFATLDLVLPGSFSAEPPELLPWVG